MSTTIASDSGNTARRMQYGDTQCLKTHSCINLLVPHAYFQSRWQHNLTLLGGLSLPILGVLQLIKLWVGKSMLSVFPRWIRKAQFEHVLFQGGGGQVMRTLSRLTPRLVLPYWAGCGNSRLLKTGDPKLKFARSGFDTPNGSMIILFPENSSNNIYLFSHLF